MATCMIALAHTDYLNVRYSFVLVVLHCNYYPYLTYLWPEIRKMILDIIAVYMHLVIPVTIATAMAADVMRQRCFSVRRGPRRQIESTGCNPIWRTNWWCDVSVGKYYTSLALTDQINIVNKIRQPKFRDVEIFLDMPVIWTDFENLVSPNNKINAVEILIVCQSEWNFVSRKSFGLTLFNITANCIMYTYLYFQDEINTIPFFELSIPREIAINIFKHLNMRDLGRCCQVLCTCVAYFYAPSGSLGYIASNWIVHLPICLFVHNSFPLTNKVQYLK